MNYPLLCAVLLLGGLIVSAGCVTDGGDNVVPTPTQGFPDSVTILPDTPGVSYLLTGKISPEEEGNVELRMKAVATRDLRKDGYNIRYTFFVYNTDTVEPGWTPKSYEEVVSANIPYTTKIDRIYPSNERVIDVMLPRAANVKTLDTSRPYMYGVVAVDVTV